MKVWTLHFNYKFGALTEKKNVRSNGGCVKLSNGLCSMVTRYSVYLLIKTNQTAYVCIWFGKNLVFPSGRPVDEIHRPMEFSVKNQKSASPRPNHSAWKLDPSRIWERCIMIHVTIPLYAPSHLVKMEGILYFARDTSVGTLPECGGLPHSTQRPEQVK